MPLTTPGLELPPGSRSIPEGDARERLIEAAAATAAEDVVALRAAAELARAAGIRTLYDEPRRGTAGSSINFLHPKDAGGVLVELVQSADRSGQSAEDLSAGTEIGVASAESATASGTMTA